MSKPDDIPQDVWDAAAAAWQCADNRDDRGEGSSLRGAQRVSASPMRPTDARRFTKAATVRETPVPQQPCASSPLIYRPLPLSGQRGSRP